MKRVLIALAFMAVANSTQAQFKSLLNKAKNKIQQRADSKVDKALDKTLDDLEGRNKDTTSTPGSSTQPVENNISKPDLKSGIISYSKFDFVPGERIIYTEDFAQDAVGELPLTWNSSGKGEVMTLDGKIGKWVRGHQKNTLLSGNKKSLGENYTIEFDLIYYYDPKGNNYVMPDMHFGMFSSGSKDNSDNSWLQNQQDTAAMDIYFHPSNNSAAYIESTQKRETIFKSDRVDIPFYLDLVNVVTHFSIQVQKTRLRLWRNETKLFDVPRAIATGTLYNQLYFKMNSSSYNDDAVGYYLSNIKMATGVPDTRHKLIGEGRFSTTGILFDFQSAVIRPESYGVIREIAGVLKENPTVKVNIIGHTSNDGDARANLELSKQRAAAVKAVLIKEYGIENDRLQTDGKGGTQPVADDKSKEGKSQNRRVEFIKL